MERLLCSLALFFLLSISFSYRCVLCLYVTCFDYHKSLILFSLSLCIFFYLPSLQPLQFFFYFHFISFCFCTLYRTTFIVFTYLMIGLKAQRNARLELCKRNKTKRNNPKTHRFQCTHKDICRKDKMRQNLLIYFD